MFTVENLTTVPAQLASAAAPMSGAGPHEWGGPPFPFFVIPLFWLLVVGGIVTAVLLTRRRRHFRWAARSGQSALAERYAAGEISEDEYRHRRTVLHEKPCPPHRAPRRARPPHRAPRTDRRPPPACHPQYRYGRPGA